jgi:hypothetical protein
MIDITRARMRSQCLTGDPPATPGEVVQRLGAVQCQDFGPGKWSIAQRTGGVTQVTMDQACAAGSFLRTHVLRPTWHFVLPADIRWMLELTAPRVLALSASYYRNQDLDSAMLKRCTAVLVGALAHGDHLTRAEIAGVLERAGIPTNPLRLGFILMHAELNAVVCSGAPCGKQQTYALLEERAPEARRLSREEALAELTVRYFTGHGPATVKDLRWWSSLTLADITQGLAMVASLLEHEGIDGTTYWFAPLARDTALLPPTVHMVQGYDEYIVGYGESKYLFDASGVARSLPRARGIYTHSIILDGQVVGEWKAVPKKHAVILDVTLFTPLEDAQTQALRLAVQRYGEYLGVPATLSLAG